MTLLQGSFHLSVTTLLKTMSIFLVPYWNFPQHDTVKHSFSSETFLLCYFHDTAGCVISCCISGSSYPAVSYRYAFSSQESASIYMASIIIHLRSPTNFTPGLSSEFRLSDLSSGSSSKSKACLRINTFKTNARSCLQT